MKRLLWIFLCLLVPCALTAQVSVLSVVTEDSHTQKEDFWHTFEYYILQPGRNAKKCQATRVGKKWFATAAHCVADACARGCSLRIDLLDQPVSVLSQVRHTPKNPQIFVHPRYDPQKPVVHDFALFKADLERVPSTYYRRGKEQNIAISRTAFNAYLKQHPQARREFNRVLRPSLPPLLVFDGETYRIDRTLSVISIFDGERTILHNPNQTDYVKELGFAYTQNFGVRQGMSGSGVMTNTGELAGIISAHLGIHAPGQADRNYFMFAVFNPDLTSFMESVMGSDYYKLERRDAYPHYIAKTRRDHRAIIRAVRAAGLSGKKSP